MPKKKLFPLININSPVILGFFFVSLGILLFNDLTGGRVNRLLACYRTSWSDVFMYLRLFTHVLPHQNLAHFTGNYLLILAVGPLVEEKYGGQKTILMVAFTAVITGLIHILFFQHTMLIGASGLVFMLILLASFTNIRDGRLPLTVLLVGLLYIGNEAVIGIRSTDNISHLPHIAGGICGAGFGFFFHGGKIRKLTK
jgi:membrane associated rhomboid family serine protease